MMNPMERLNEISGKVIGAAMEVHRELGPGLHENEYENALCIEMDLRGIRYERQKIFDVKYKGRHIGTKKLDLLVEDEVVIEAKAVDKLVPVFDAQVIAYLKVTNLTLGLLINFNVALLKDGIKRIILTRD